VERSLVASAVKRFDGARYELHGWVVMDDHVHVILTPSGCELASILKSWKSFTGRVLRRERRTASSIWQKEYFDRIIRDDAEFAQQIEYIARNPAKRWPEIKNYPWVWLRSR
jgi:REP element-mobilizing transposase RayT